MDFSDSNPYEPLTDEAFETDPSPNFSLFEHVEWALPPDLDLFFARMYRYWCGKGFFASLLKEVTNLIALLFFLLFSAFILFFVNWSASREDCEEKEGMCDIAQLYIQNPMQSTKLSSWTVLRLLYILLFGVYVLGTSAVAVNEVRRAWHIRQFCRMKLGISEERIKDITWAELVHRLVLIQRTTRLCRQKDLEEIDIINRILRKENYLVGMINKGVLNLSVPCIGYRKRNILTKMIEWSLRWGILNPMFDRDFQIRYEYRTEAIYLTKRFRLLAIVNLLLAPFLLVFLVIYFFMINLERFYHSPVTMTERSWTAYAVWSIREFSELEHQLEARLSMSLKPAQDYINQFPNIYLMHVAKLLAFLLGSFMALWVGIAWKSGSLLEHGAFLGYNLLWWGAILIFGLGLARGLLRNDAVQDPDTCMEEVAKHTHFYPKLWHRRGRSKDVQESFRRMFRYRALNFFDEVLSIFLAPYILYFSLPQSSESIVQFLRDYTVRLDGVGDICSLAAFDFERHGNKKYGSIVEGAKSSRSKHGKLEKSFLAFAASYPSWQPSRYGQELLSNRQRSADSSNPADALISSLHVNHSVSQSARRRSRTSSGQRESGTTIEMSSLMSATSSQPHEHAFAAEV